MRAITLWRPWDQAMLYGGKTVENRPWALWKNMIGVPMALHAGKKYDKDGAEYMADSGLYIPPPQHESPTGIVGVVIFDRVIHKDICGRLFVDNDPMSNNDWFSGPYGWLVKEIFHLPKPIDCLGMQGIWPTPPEVMSQIIEQLPQFKESE